LELIENLDGNPSGVDVRWYSDHLVATRAAAAPDVAWMQHVAGLAPSDAPLVREIVAWYAEANIRPRFEIAPADDFAPLADALRACGAQQSSFIDVLWARSEDIDVEFASAHIDSVDIRVVAAGTDDAKQYALAHLGGHEVPAPAVEAHWPAVAAWAGEPTYRCYLAAIDGEPVSAAALAVTDGIGYFANAATLPHARGHGCQSALIARRWRDAAAEGCEIVLSLANLFSSSHRNLQRAGLTTAYTKVMWTVEA
jgi:hypothetical protein